jgi:ribosomal protein S18 acetylase RimI-like enzyme
MSLAVRKDQRRGGLARALLVDCFELSRANGRPRAELSTDSRTGALGLYERVGMRITSTWLHRAIEV